MGDHPAKNRRGLTVEPLQPIRLISGEFDNETRNQEKQLRK
jgi:hypothetical protein